MATHHTAHCVSPRSAVVAAIGLQTVVLFGVVFDMRVSWAGRIGTGRSAVPFGRAESEQRRDVKG